jgi:hypothetical protein
MSTTLNILSFADDTTVYRSGNKLVELVRFMNIELDNIYVWLCENKLVLNADKTKFMIFSPQGSNLTENVDIFINRKVIERCGNGQVQTPIQFLGIHLDEHFTWKFHLEHLVKNISRTLYILNKVKRFLPQSSLRSLYFALVHSRLSYGFLAWENSASATKLFKIQKRAVRIISNKGFKAHTDPIFKSLHILKLMDFYEYQVLLFSFDYFNNRIPISLYNFYPNPRGRVTTRMSTNNNFFEIIHILYGTLYLE